MTAPRERLRLEPRLLSAEMAAAYCGVSRATFLAHFAPPPRIVGRRKLYDRRAIDRMLDRQAVEPAPSPSHDDDLKKAIGAL